MNHLFVVNIDRKRLGTQIDALTAATIDEPTKQGMLNLLTEISAQVEGIVEKKLAFESEWECPKCSEKQIVPNSDIPDIGNPMCCECGLEMEHTRDLVFLEGQKAPVYQS